MTVKVSLKGKTLNKDFTFHPKYCINQCNIIKMYVFLYMFFLVINNFFN